MTEYTSEKVGEYEVHYFGQLPTKVTFQDDQFSSVDIHKLGYDNEELGINWGGYGTKDPKFAQKYAGAIELAVNITEDYNRKLSK